MKKKKRSVVLTVSLAVIMVMLYLFGFMLSQTVFLGKAMYEDTPIPALPYIFMFDSKFKNQLIAEMREKEAIDELKNTERYTEDEDTDNSYTETYTESAETETIADEAPNPVKYVLGTVDESYFDDALFIGDSRTDGLSLYSPLGEAYYFANKGVTVFDLFSVTDRDGSAKLEDVLAEGDYGKIYIMLGVNEIGYNFNSIITQYSEALDRLRELVPDAIIVIQGNLAVSEKKSSGTWYLTAARIHELNELQSKLADNEHIFYIDANEIFCDENGYLKEELSGDGVHLYAKNYAEWSEWMCKNAYVPDISDDE